ncbi:unnamed protein product [Trichobilharzia regenti]|nr:unnamed protein product [Trichobilharzia regenti]
MNRIPARFLTTQSSSKHVLAHSAALMNCVMRDIINRPPRTICYTPSVLENTTDDSSGNNAINNTAPGIISSGSNKCSCGSHCGCVDGGIKIPTTSVLPNYSCEPSGGDYSILTDTQQTPNEILDPRASFSRKSVYGQKEPVQRDNGKRQYVYRKPGCGAAFVRIYMAKLYELTHVVDRKGSTRLSQYAAYVEHVMNGVNSGVGGERIVVSPRNLSPTIPNPTSAKTAIVIPSSNALLKPPSQVDKYIYTYKCRLLRHASPPKPNPPPRMSPITHMNRRPCIAYPYFCPWKACSKIFVSFILLIEPRLDY